jgi:hypothetical protein
MPYGIQDENVRVHARANMDSVSIERLDYPENRDTRGELSIVMTGEAGHLRGAVPIVDVLKYVLLREPDLLEAARVQLDEAAEEEHAAAKARAEVKHNEGQAFCEAFLAAFPSKKESSYLACDTSETWMQMIDGAPTTGEGCIVNGLPVYDHWTTNYELYDMGILKTVAEWAKTQGMYGEPYDSGTLKFYRI